MYEVAIIGGGPAGYNAAIRAGQLGLKVVCIEGGPHLGGTCLNVGCMPSKALLHASERYEEAFGELARLGIDVTPRLNLQQMMAQKDETVAKLVSGVEYLFRKNKVDQMRGWASFITPQKLRIRDVNGGITELEAREIVIATGSAPSRLPGVCIDGTSIVTSSEALSFPEVPASLAIIGAGVIGLELGSVWRRLGSHVTVLEFQDRILPEMDEEVAATFAKMMTRQGMLLRLGVRVASASPVDGGASVEFAPVAGGDVENLRFDKVLVAAGRRPFTDGLGLDKIGLKTDRRGRLPHESFRTAVPHVWVIGDVTTGPMLAHKAEDEAISCIEAIAGLVETADHAIIPSVVYTRPEIATVGSTEESLKRAGTAYRVGRFQFMANSRARINHETGGFAKLLVDARNDRILGVHMVGPDVSEMIGEACVAMSMGATAEDVARTSHPHPTRSEALRQAAMDVAGWAMQA